MVWVENNVTMLVFGKCHEFNTENDQHGGLIESLVSEGYDYLENSPPIQLVVMVTR